LAEIENAKPGQKPKLDINAILGELNQGIGNNDKLG
jgi:hypothetical protein